MSIVFLIFSKFFYIRKNALTSSVPSTCLFMINPSVFFILDSSSLSPKIQNNIENSKGDWLIFKNIHEPIV